jgi:hypothetical protein
MRALALLLIFVSIPAHAHRMGLARLIIDQRDGVTLSLSLNGQAAKHQLRPLPPSGCVSLAGWKPVGDALHLTSTWSCKRLIYSVSLSTQGRYEGSLMAALISDSTTTERVSRGGADLDFTNPENPISSAHFKAGVDHMMRGWDHLLLIALIATHHLSLSTLLAATLAFTLGHALSLSVVALTSLNLRLAPIEACIALSLLFMAWLSLRRDAELPLALLLGFGVLHGLGLASGFSSTGLSGWGLASAVALFNLGVEAAQVAWLLGIIVLIRWIPGQFAQHALAYSAGGLSAFWLIQRSFALGT